MKIAIVTITTTDKITGVAEYLINLIENYQKLDNKNEFYILTSIDNQHMFNIYGNNFHKVILPFKHKPWLLMRSIFNLWLKFIFPIWCKFNKVDVVHLPNTMFTSRFIRKTIVTIHDIVELKTKKYSLIRTYLRKRMITSIIKNSRIIIAVSSNSKKDIVELGATNVEVVYNGFDQNLFNTISITALKVEKYLSESKLLPNKYILNIGTLMKHKNIPTMIDSFSEGFKEIHEIKLVIVGASDNAYDEVIDHIQNSAIKDRIVLLGYVSKEEKLMLLKNCNYFCLPSLYEGFGFPILEAQVAGVPVLTSIFSCLPEVGGKGVYCVDTKNISLFTTSMKTMFFDEVLRKNLIEEGKNNVKRFSWEKCAQDTLSIYYNS